MNEPINFYPPRRLGLILHTVVIILLAGAVGWGVWRASQAAIGPEFVLYLLPALLGAVLIPIIFYRAYALWNAAYLLARSGIYLRWGLRSEAIPIEQVLWVRTARELEEDLPLPVLRWPGSIVGLRRLRAGGKVEYLASSAAKLVLIGTAGQAFAISPDNPGAFLNAFQHLMELGSIAPIQPVSQHPSFLLARIWRARPARALLLAGVILNLLLLVWVSLDIPNREQIVMGFLPGREPIPAVQLLLLPLLSAFFYLSDTFGGLFFFRRASRAQTPSQSPDLVMAYVLWGMGALTPLIFALAVWLILHSGPLSPG